MSEDTLKKYKNGGLFGSKQVGSSSFVLLHYS